MVLHGLKTQPLLDKVELGDGFFHGSAFFSAVFGLESETV
jgi:hypothetical protein